MRDLVALCAILGLVLFGLVVAVVIGEDDEDE